MLMIIILLPPHAVYRRSQSMSNIPPIINLLQYREGINGYRPPLHLYREAWTVCGEMSTEVAMQMYIEELQRVSGRL